MNSATARDNADAIESLKKSAALIPMNKDFIGEPRTSFYLRTAMERAPYVITLLNGKPYDSKGELITKKRMLYVLAEDYVLYGIHESAHWNHSFFLAGGPVRAAGFFETNYDSLVSLISNESGHYTPTLEQMLCALEFFYKNLSNTIPIQYESHDEALKGIIKYYHLESLAKLSELENIDQLVTHVYRKPPPPVKDQDTLELLESIKKDVETENGKNCESDSPENDGSSSDEEQQSESDELINDNRKRSLRTEGREKFKKTKIEQLDTSGYEEKIESSMPPRFSRYGRGPAREKTDAEIASRMGVFANSDSQNNNLAVLEISQSPAFS